MPTFVSTLVDTISSTSVAFVSDVVINYWDILLGLGFLMFIGSYFYRFAKGGGAR